MAFRWFIDITTLNRIYSDIEKPLLYINKRGFLITELSQGMSANVHFWDL